MQNVFKYLGRSVMYIQPVNNNINMQAKPPSNGKNKNVWRKTVDYIKQKILDVSPEKTFSDANNKVETWNKWNKNLTHPATNRLIMGVTALATQPVIDYSNHKVDKETREISRNRTIAKIVAGTTVGIAVRGACFELVSSMINIKGKGRLSKALLSKKYLRELVTESGFLDNHRNALANAVGILAMCFTNFLIDAPLTVYLTNRFNEKTKQKNLEKKEERLVLNG